MTGDEEKLIQRLDESYRLARLQVQNFENLIKQYYSTSIRNRREYLEVLKEGYLKSMDYLTLIRDLIDESQNIYSSSRWEECDKELTLFE